MQLYKSELKIYLKHLINTQKWDKQTIMKIIWQLIMSIKQLHDVDVIHGDIAMRNFLVDANQRIYVTDFGLSHKLEKNIHNGVYNEFYSVVDVKPTPFWWCAPEVLERMLNRENLILTKKSDVYMLGCTMAEVNNYLMITI